MWGIFRILYLLFKDNFHYMVNRQPSLWRIRNVYYYQKISCDFN